MIEISDIVLQLKKQEDRRIASQPVDWVTDIFFQMNIVKRYILSIADYKNVTLRNIREPTKNDGFQRVLLRWDNAKKDGCGKICVGKMTEVLRNQLEICVKVDIIFCLKRVNALSGAASPTMTKPHIGTCCREEKKEVMGYLNSCNV